MYHFIIEVPPADKYGISSSTVVTPAPTSTWRPHSQCARSRAWPPSHTDWTRKRGKRWTRRCRASLGCTTFTISRVESEFSWMFATDLWTRVTSILKIAHGAVVSEEHQRVRDGRAVRARRPRICGHQSQGAKFHATSSKLTCVAEEGAFRHSVILHTVVSSHTSTVP